MILYLHSNKLVISETKRPKKKDFETTSGKIKIHDWNDALSEWQKNLIPVKEGEENKFLLIVSEILKCQLIDKHIDNQLQNGIYIDDEAIKIKQDCSMLKVGCVDCGCQKFAYLNNQPKKEESNEAIEQEKLWKELLKLLKDVKHDETTLLSDVKKKFKLTKI